MATNAYLERMNQLQAERTSNNEKELSSAAGLPIQRPNNQTGSPSGVPTGESPKPEEDESYKQTQFYKNFDNFNSNDKHFSGMFDELQKLATGLREQVQLGYMPQQIAEQRLKQFVGDSSAQYARMKPQIDKEKAEEEKQAQMKSMLGALMQQSQGNQQQAPQEMPPEGMSAQQMMQQEPQQPEQQPNPTQQGGM